MAEILCEFCGKDCKNKAGLISHVRGAHPPGGKRVRRARPEKPGRDPSRARDGREAHDLVVADVLFSKAEELRAEARRIERIAAEHFREHPPGGRGELRSLIRSIEEGIDDNRKRLELYEADPDRPGAAVRKDYLKGQIDMARQILRFFDASK